MLECRDSVMYSKEVLCGPKMLVAYNVSHPTVTEAENNEVSNELYSGLS